MMWTEARKKGWAMQAALKIWDDCMDRRTLKWALADVSLRVKWDDILPTWARLIEQESKRV